MGDKDYGEEKIYISGFEVSSKDAGQVQLGGGTGC